MTDYHDFCWRGASKEWRDRLFIGDIYVNAAICKLCGYFIRSKNKHDYRKCKCGAIAVDGGSHYCKRMGNSENIENIIELFTDVIKNLPEKDIDIDTSDIPELGAEFWKNAVIRYPKSRNSTGDDKEQS